MQPQPPPNDGRKFLNLSAGMLALVIAVVILAPILLCFGCLAMGILGMAAHPYPMPTP